MSDFSPENFPVLQFNSNAWDWFQAACADLEIPIDNDKKQRLERIYSHLLGVNEFLNLTRILTQEDYLKYHVFDSLTALSLVEHYTEPGDNLADLLHML